MSGYKWPPKVTFPTTSKINWCKIWLALKDDFSRPRLSHLYPLIYKAKKKSNQVSYLVSIHLIFPVSSILNLVTKHSRFTTPSDYWWLYIFMVRFGFWSIKHTVCRSASSYAKLTFSKKSNIVSRYNARKSSTGNRTFVYR